MATLELKYNTWTDFLTAASEGVPPVQERRASRDGSKSFTGTVDYGEAVDLGRRGWPEGVKQALAISEPIQQNLYGVIALPRIEYDVTGELLDVGRFASGEPEHWGNWEHNLKEGKGTKYVHVVMNGTASCGVDASVLIARGAVTSALVNLLEMAGHRVKVTLCYGVAECHGGPAYMTTTVSLKQYDEVLDLDRLTYALAHPSTFRRHFFSIMECQTVEHRKRIGVPNGGYGQQANMPPAEQGDIYLEKMTCGDARWTDPEQATVWVRQHLTDLGVISKEETPV